MRRPSLPPPDRCSTPTAQLAYRSLSHRRNDHIKIGDLGVAKVLTTHLRAAHTGVGTPYYLSPEVAQRRPYNAKSDVWALGCILYECCTRRHPFTGNTQAQLFQQIIRASYRPIPSSYSADIAGCVKACLTRSVRAPSPLLTQLSKPLLTFFGGCAGGITAVAARDHAAPCLHRESARDGHRAPS